VHKCEHYLLNKVSLTKKNSTEISVGARGGELGRQHNYVVITVIIPIRCNPNVVNTAEEYHSYRIIYTSSLFPPSSSFCVHCNSPRLLKVSTPKNLHSGLLLAI